MHTAIIRANHRNESFSKNIRLEVLRVVMVRSQELYIIKKPEFHEAQGILLATQNSKNVCCQGFLLTHI